MDLTVRRFFWSPIGLFSIFVALILAGGAWATFGRHGADHAPSETDLAWDRLIAYEASQRHGVDFAKRPTWDRVSGPDPYALRAIPHLPFLVGVLRGADAIVFLNASLRELQRLPAPAGAIGLTVPDDRYVFIVGELSSTIARYKVVEDG